MKTFILFLEAKDDNEKMAAGILFHAKDTGKFGVALRSAKCDTPNHYGTVGGSLKKGEQPHEAAVRETQEEIGYSIDSDKLEPLDQNKSKNFTYHTYLYHINKQSDMKNLDLNDENDKFVWFDLKNPPKPLHPGFAQTLDKTRNKLENLTNENRSNLR